MNKFNSIYLQEGFNSEVILKYYQQIDKLSADPLIVYVTGTGGSVQKTVSIVDVLLSLDVPTTVISRDYCASSCARFPHAGNFIRLAYEHTRFVYHATEYAPQGDIEMLEISLERCRLTTQLKIRTLMQHVGLTEREAKKYDGKDITMTSEQCLMVGKHGMLDGIIIKDYRDGRFLIKTRDGNKEIDVTKHRRSDIKNLPIVKG